MNNENLTKMYVNENKIVRPFLVAGSRKNAGGKNEGDLRDVVENTWSKNVRFPPFQDVDEKKRVIVAFPGC